ncbi:MAG TPA: HDIG domain-containing protein [Candidatus Deferrimicrobium sp.]|nr:HDIG domain-containing protein [Candidatus Deferrimicrobium sp.]
MIRLKRRIRKFLHAQPEGRQFHVPTKRARILKYILLAVATLAVGIIYPGERLYDPLDMPRKGEIALEDILAPFQIIVHKTDQELKVERDLARSAVPAVLEEDTLATRGVFDRLNGFFFLSDSLHRALKDSALSGNEQAVQLLAERFPSVSSSAVTQSLARDDLQRVQDQLQRILRDELYQTGVTADLKVAGDAHGKNVLIRRGNHQELEPRESLLDLTLSNARLLTALNKLAKKDSVDVEYYYLIGRAFVAPNLHVNQAEYRRLVDRELSGISEVRDVVNTGDIIVRSGTKVSERQYRILHEMIRLKRMQPGHQGRLWVMAPVLARIALAAAVFSILYLFMYFFRRDVFYSNSKLLALLIVFAFALGLLFVAEQAGLSVYLFPIAILPIVITILFDSEVGVLATVVLALLLGIMHRFDFSLGMMTVVVGTVASFVSRRVRKRTDFFKIMLSIAAAYAGFAFIVENMKMSPSSEFVTEMGYGVINGLVSALLAIGVLPLFESVFGITTDITLLELSDLNHPLLKRLAMEAPGTFQHSLNVGNLSEAGAKAIHANSLLARVGAYYHDIGKIEIPEYFVENQLGIKSKHESLTPSMSAIILSSHVKKGRLLGEEAGLPDDVLNFVEEHHGTMLMSYFYDKALKQGADSAARDKFRYPGPRPQTRETAIAMLADAIEAASRTLDEPTPARINTLIQRVINDRFQSGELDTCPLTLRDLAKIKEAFAQFLMASFHRRLSYPSKEKAEYGA